ncbi:MAG: histidine acid phosphatase [Muribaculaceae bacterium]|nr:histidine acid phosphatase [Muribaculaceae bacterium]
MLKSIRYLLILSALTCVGQLSAAMDTACDSVRLVYKLHGQTRRFSTTFCRQPDGSVTLDWEIERNLRMWHGSYTMLPEAVKSGDALSYLMPEDGNHVTLPANETFAMLSRQSLDSLVTAGHATIGGIGWTLVSAPDAPVIEATAAGGTTRMSVSNNPVLPLITSMQGNPHEINWTATPIQHRRAKTARELIAECPGRSGGIYYAYPHDSDVMPAMPDGYEVTFISHYGRHGSRWIIKTWEYDEAIAALDSAARLDGLTPLGHDVLGRLHVFEQQARGNAGALSPLGERQHRGIARRLHDRFPRLFDGSHARVVAHSSIEPRCIMSMSAFSEQLKELNPRLTVNRHAAPGDMNFISYSNADMKAVNASTADWWNDLTAWRDSVVQPGRLMASLFTDPTGVPDPIRLAWILHDIAIDGQDVEPGVDLMDIFTTDELYDLWSALNYKMYYLHGNNPVTGAPGPRSAANLLTHFVNDIDSMAAGLRPDRTVTLRFGHDTALLRLLALMQIEGADASIANPGQYADDWQDFNLTPMAANLQVILLTSADGDEPLVLIRLNERPARLPLESLHGGYYRWSDVSRLWQQAIDSANAYK